MTQEETTPESDHPTIHSAAPTTVDSSCLGWWPGVSLTTLGLPSSGPAEGPALCTTSEAAQPAPGQVPSCLPSSQAR